MYAASLKFVVFLLALAYVGAGVASIIQMRREPEFHIGWTLLAGLWLFLAVAVWRLSRIARTVSMTLLWIVVLGGVLLAAQPLFFPELPPIINHPGLQGRPAFFLVAVLLALIGLWILGKNKKEFR